MLRNPNKSNKMVIYMKNNKDIKIEDDMLNSLLYGNDHSLRNVSRVLRMCKNMDTMQYPPRDFNDFAQEDVEKEFKEMMKELKEGVRKEVTKDKQNTIPSLIAYQGILLRELDKITPRRDKEDLEHVLLILQIIHAIDEFVQRNETITEED